jgi:hypothetical protein
VIGPTDEGLDAFDLREWIGRARRGDFEGAWTVSDRILRRNGPTRDPTVPRHLQRVWDGSPLTGKRVLIRCYHGLGDTIQFVRYAPLVQDIARQVIVWAQPALLPLLRSAPGIDVLLGLHDGEPKVAYEADIEIMELPYAFRTTLETIPNRVPYLSAAPIVLAGGQVKAGLVWRGGAWDAGRSIRFEDLTPLLNLDHVSWYALQLEMKPDERHERLEVLDTCGVLRTAQIMRALDLVITIDSMAAHLAGALAVPVWTLLPHDADWRWMEQCDGSPWYPTMRLFRQPSPGGWHSTIARVRDALTARPACRTA